MKLIIRWRAETQRHRPEGHAGDRSVLADSERGLYIARVCFRIKNATAPRKLLVDHLRPQVTALVCNVVFPALHHRFSLLQWSDSPV